MRVPGSKSATHRALVLAANCPGTSHLQGALRAEDTERTAHALEMMGAQIRWHAEGCTVAGTNLGPPTHPIDCGNSGTTLRFMLAQAARFDQASEFDGDASLRLRPTEGLASAMQEHGAQMEGTGPWQIQGPLQAGAFAPRGSSQFASGLCLTAPFLTGPSTIDIADGQGSAGYIDMTLALMQAFGLQSARVGQTISIPGTQVGSATRLHIEGDWSSAAFLYGAAALTRTRVTLENLDERSLQPDRVILDFLARFGADVNGLTVTGRPLRRPGVIDVAPCPDLFPILAVIAAFVPGPTQFIGGAALRDKESDRIASIAEALAAMGVLVEQNPTGCTIHGASPRAATVHNAGDHRIDMALRVAQLACPGLTIQGEPVSAVSYPGFQEALAPWRAA